MRIDWIRSFSGVKQFRRASPTLGRKGDDFTMDMDRARYVNIGVPFVHSTDFI